MLESIIKLEIGSTVRPDPYSKRIVKTYIHEFLESKGFEEDIAKFELSPISVNTLNIERTFIDKVMSVKRHAICGSLDRKVRHIYDVYRLFSMTEIQTFLANEEELKTGSAYPFYLSRQNVSPEYDPSGPYHFSQWCHHFDENIRTIYENLHNILLYTNQKQDFDAAYKTFEKIDTILQAIGE